MYTRTIIYEVCTIYVLSGYSWTQYIVNVCSRLTAYTYVYNPRTLQLRGQSVVEFLLRVQTVLIVYDFAVILLD